MLILARARCSLVSGSMTAIARQGVGVAVGGVESCSFEQRPGAEAAELKVMVGASLLSVGGQLEDAWGAVVGEGRTVKESCRSLASWAAAAH